MSTLDRLFPEKMRRLFLLVASPTQHLFVSKDTILLEEHHVNFVSMQRMYTEDNIFNMVDLGKKFPHVNTERIILCSINITFAVVRHVNVAVIKIIHVI